MKVAIAVKTSAALVGKHLRQMRMKKIVIAAIKRRVKNEDEQSTNN